MPTLVTEVWQTILAADATVSDEFHVANSGDYQVSFQGLTEDGEIAIEATVDDAWVPTGDVVTGSDAELVDDESGTRTGTIILQARRQDLYRMTPSAAGPVVKITTGE